MIKRPLNDATFYIANVQFLRGEPLTYQFKEPFNERLLVTAVAAILPFEPLTAINLANIFFLLLALYFLRQLLTALSLDEKYVWGGLYLFVFSFPTFYYSTIGYTDPGALSMIFLGASSIYKNKYWLFILAMILGTMAKEGIVILVPVAAAYAFSRDDKKWYFFSAAAILIFFAITAVVKSNIAEHVNTPFFWKPRAWRIYFNFSRPNFYISSILSFGIPGVIWLTFLFRETSQVTNFLKQDLPLITGTLAAFLPWLFMIISAFPDGRAFWIASCFPIALAMVWWQRFGNPFKFKS
ncbi:hypothetical protein [Dyadobacter psychrotolerans]|uniref:Glycosyltransferase RgtA/B/C/D-like domain-containing protein n=1 Tax=Dyadobacter psychrotolerans TaxID=2541721 RepID=A0A4V2Z4G7_9BACT|nr:hypothetical protein [Dyadobacter psychrotolerans]TDE16648.1 hypothetical protein E0F88_10475 [Dyadobacter psychrotolerans]